MKKVTILSICIFVLLLFVNRFSIFIIENHTNYDLPFSIDVPQRSMIVPWLNFDGLNYLKIAIDGYPQGDILSVYFPVYPVLIRLLSLNLIINPILVGLFISLTCALIASILFYGLVKKEFSEKVALKSAFLLLVFPSSFYLFAYYTESLFLLLSILVFWFLNKKNLFLASVVTTFATATRITGLALVPVLIYEGYKHYKIEKKIPWPIIIAPIGFIFYSIFTYLKFGNPFLMVTAQSDPRFGRPLTFLSPFLVIKDAVGKIINGPLVSYDNPFVYPVIILEFIFAVFALIILLLILKKLPKRYSIYTGFSILIIFFGGALSSIIRYLLIIFPIFIFLALHLSKRSSILWSVISLALLLFASTLFLRNYWVS